MTAGELKINGVNTCTTFSPATNECNPNLYCPGKGVVNDEMYAFQSWSGKHGGIANQVNAFWDAVDNNGKHPLCDLNLTVAQKQEMSEITAETIWDNTKTLTLPEYCATRVGSVNGGGLPNGCSGAGYQSNGKISSNYCTGLGNNGTKYPWYETCCDLVGKCPDCNCNPKSSPTAPTTSS